MDPIATALDVLRTEQEHSSAVENMVTPLEELPTPDFEQPSSTAILGDYSCGVLGSLPSPADLDFADSAAPTPYSDPQLQSSLSLLPLGLTACDIPLGSPPVNRNNLQLPSFNMLGISNDHPDKIASIQYPLASSWMYMPPALPSLSSGLGGGSNSELDPMQTTSPPMSTPSLSPYSVQPGHLNAQDYMLSREAEEEPKIDQWTLGPPPFNLPIRPRAQGNDAPGNITASLEGLTMGELPVVSPLDSPCLKNAPWMQRVITVIVKNTGEQLARTSDIKMVCQALPRPSLHGHAYPALINALYQCLRPRQLRWMNVFHAVPGSMNLAELPSSPPTTPGPPGSQSDDYFAMTVFDSAVAVPDYQQRELRTTVFSPKPAVAPGSVNISIVERYIPPTNAKEFEELFFEKGHSLLSDRLLELSSDNGILVFVYPTRAGGETFTKDYLGPIIDPLLRKLMISESLNSSVLDQLGTMSAVKELSSFEEMNARVKAFCTSLTENTGASTMGTSPRPSSKGKAEKGTVAEGSTSNSLHTRAEYTVLDSFPYLIHPNKTAWAEDWWVKQEKPRIRHILADYLSRTNRVREGSSKDTPLFAGFELVETILNGVANLKYADETSSSTTTPVIPEPSSATPQSANSEGFGVHFAGNMPDAMARPILSRGLSLGRMSVASAPRPPLIAPTAGIEVGIFIVKKSAPPFKQKTTT